MFHVFPRCRQLWRGRVAAYSVEMSDQRRIVDDPFDEGRRLPAPREKAPTPEEEESEEEADEESIIVPPEALSADVLAALIEEFVTRHGTDLSDAADKVTQVRGLLKNGKVEIVYDPSTQSCNIISRS